MSIVLLLCDLEVQERNQLRIFTRPAEAPIDVVVFGSERCDWNEDWGTSVGRGVLTGGLNRHRTEGGWVVRCGVTSGVESSHLVITPPTHLCLYP
ncbi:hypothetical protein Pmani_009492 [Petrolisthes manimaculis]|uniref:Uncharacterized protein n=1 Tax=Petrolisthes manimaculis TaxID=1843537 RepID=A0AAE1Q6X0_9EUCA|nr:hypothetical protein Pmani_009492 [Petrolisthes manimaculis]